MAVVKITVVFKHFSDCGTQCYLNSWSLWGIFRENHVFFLVSIFNLSKNGLNYRKKISFCLDVMLDGCSCPRTESQFWRAKHDVFWKDLRWNDSRGSCVIDSLFLLICSHTVVLKLKYVQGLEQKHSQGQSTSPFLQSPSSFFFSNGLWRTAFCRSMNLLWIK